MYFPTCPRRRTLVAGTPATPGDHEVKSRGMDRATRLTNALFGDVGPAALRPAPRPQVPAEGSDSDSDAGAPSGGPVWQGTGDGRPRSVAMPLFLTGCCVHYLSIAGWMFIPGTHGVSPEWRQTQYVVSNALVVLSMYSYFTAYYIDPTVPLEEERGKWAAPGTDGVWPWGQAADVEGGGEVCKRCSVVKQNRIHHCRRCGRCVHRYDHHCEWIDNCVGHANHNAFLLFILYISLLAYHYWYLLVAYVYTTPSGHVHGRVPLSSSLATVYVQFFTIVVSFLTFFATVFLVWSFYLLAHNATSYDFAAGGTNVYGRGLYRNVAAVCGANPLWWLFPRDLPPPPPTRPAML
eukprot:TRINITY_DN8001_c0_g1_i1.p1 TRINITY_DN8001_c0_g1~~TRINITY_DN8001_c0_g1_i1.p1  ORF type:complete len:349 (+),score=71.78 TRINITY_DN8001_c0_g1_i1:63-1109(+)